MTLAEVLSGAQDESAVDHRRVGTRRQAVEHVQRVRKTLLARCVAAWHNVEAGMVVVDVPAPTQGFGFNFGHNFGLGVGILAPEALGARMVLILKVEAQRIDDDTWHEVNVGSVHDGEQLRLPDMPVCAISDTVIRYVEPELWAPFDHVRLIGVAEYDDAAEGAAVEPNAQVAPLFARYLVLDLAAWLATKQRESALAFEKRREAYDVLGSLLRQCRSQSSIEVRR